MNIVGRLKNAYKTGGITEILRKSAYKTVYSLNNRRTLKDIKNSETEYGVRAEKRKRRIIVSLTSFPPRFDNIGLCIKSLLCQDVKPDKIMVYFSNDTTEADLTPEMKGFTKYGVEYVFNTEYNLKPHDKYLHAMMQYPDDIVVTADDDIVYPKNWLRSLLNAHKKYPGCVCARRVHLMTYDKNGNLKKYNHWTDQCRSVAEPSMQLIATGNGGVLYPPHCLYKDAFNIEKITELALDADDIWLKCMELLNGTKVVWVKNNEVDPASVSKINVSALSSSNVDECKNDVILKRVMEAYNIDEKMFMEK